MELYGRWHAGLLRAHMWASPQCDVVRGEITCDVVFSMWELSIVEYLSHVPAAQITILDKNISYNSKLVIELSKRCSKTKTCADFTPNRQHYTDGNHSKLLGPIT